MIRVGVKYCGGCNPEIHRSELVRDVEQLLSKDCRLETGQPSERWDLAIMVCGCAAACLDRPETRDFARTWVLVSGSMVDLHAVPSDRLATKVAERLQALISVMLQRSQRPLCRPLNRERETFSHSKPPRP